MGSLLAHQPEAVVLEPSNQLAEGHSVSVDPSFT